MWGAIFTLLLNLQFIFLFVPRLLVVVELLGKPLQAYIIRRIQQRKLCFGFRRDAACALEYYCRFMFSNQRLSITRYLESGRASPICRSSSGTPRGLGSNFLLKNIDRSLWATL